LKATFSTENTETETVKVCQQYCPIDLRSVQPSERAQKVKGNFRDNLHDVK